MEIEVYDHDGRIHLVDTSGQKSAMEAIRRAGLPILAECGGSCACATCHVYLEKGSLDRIEPPGEDELAMLELADEVTERSRLSCQISVAGIRDTIILKLAPGSGS